MIGDPNPFYDPGPFGVVIIEGVLIECHLEEIDGAKKPEEWKAQKGTGSSGASNVWKGTGLAESIKLKFLATLGPPYDAMTALLAQARPKLGEKPPTLGVINGVINWGGIQAIALKDPPQPKWDKKQGAFEFEWEFTEQAPSTPANTGVADPANPNPAQKWMLPGHPENAKESLDEAKGEAKTQ